MKIVMTCAFALLLPAVLIRAQTTDGDAGVKWIEVDGTRLAYVERGAGEPVVLVHGALGDYRTWAAQVEALSKNYRVISYSRRYHHPNEWSGDGSDYARGLHAADLVALIRALKLGPVHLVGHSYGGSLAALVALEHPELVRSLVLGEPSLFAFLRSAEGEALLAGNKGEALGVVMRSARGGEHGRAVRGFIRVVVGADVFDRLPAASRSVIMQNARTLGPMLTSYFDPTRLDCERARGVKVPTLLVRGELSPEINRRIGDGLDSCLPDSKVFVLPGASHGLQMEKPAEFNEVVSQFIGKHSARSAGSRPAAGKPL